MRCFDYMMTIGLASKTSRAWLTDAAPLAKARESVYDLLPEPHGDWASVPSCPHAGAPEDERELFDIADKLPCRRRGMGMYLLVV